MCGRKTFLHLNCIISKCFEENGKIQEVFEIPPKFGLDTPPHVRWLLIITTKIHHKKILFS